jgi:phage antirepressor YoqD-like protein
MEAENKETKKRNAKKPRVSYYDQFVDRLLYFIERGANFASAARIIEHETGKAINSNSFFIYAKRKGII